MIPITWDGSKWVKANVMSAWYDYPTQKWANAVVVTSSSRNTYLNAAAGTTITEADVLAYYVWIPRYAYKITSGYHTATVGAIDVKFLIGTTNINKDNVTIATTPTYSGSAQTNYALHPAFNFGGTQVPGIWVSKFEMTGAINTPCAGEACLTAPITSKPYIPTTSVQAAIRSQALGSYYYASRSMERAGNEYGFISTEVDTHMIKNTEWGMIAYLLQSQYGKGSEVWVNPSTSHYTGCANTSNTGSASGCPNIYSSVLGVNASTTGNVYGIYDMAGGAWEFVMGNLNNVVGNGGLTPADIPNKYIDRYTNAYSSAVFGDALYETSSSCSGGTTQWYADICTTSTSYLLRGGVYVGPVDPNYSGLFASETTNGSGNANTSTRFSLIVGTGL
jgi:hypothetical protein